MRERGDIEFKVRYLLHLVMERTTAVARGSQTAARTNGVSVKPDVGRYQSERNGPKLCGVSGRLSTDGIHADRKREMPSDCSRH